jgi:hypothetical protein
LVTAPCSCLYLYGVVSPQHVLDDQLWTFMFTFLLCRNLKENDNTYIKIKEACQSLTTTLEDQPTNQGAVSPFSQQVPSGDGEKSYDVFLSYSHRNPAHAETFLQLFADLAPNLKVFYDRSELTAGT